MTQYKALNRAQSFALSAFGALLLAACASQPPAPTTYPVSVPAEAPVVSDGDPGMPVESMDEARSIEGGGLIREDASMRYVVKKGDTLWGIANKYLIDPWNWPEIWYVNDQQVKNPHRIFPGDVLELRNVKGRVKLARGGLERMGPRVRESALDDSLPAIPIDAIRNFLKGPRLVDADTLNKAPYVLAFKDEHIMAGANNGLFVKNLTEAQGNVFQIVRKGETYRDPDTKEILGYEAIPTGESEVIEFGAASDVNITQSYREVLRGDRLLPPEADNFQANFYPHSPKNPVGGKIISVFNALSQIAQYQIVAMNRGSNHGLEAGHVLTIFQPSRKVKDPYTGKMESLPQVRAGVLMVFKVTPKLSYGLIMNADRPVHLLDNVEKPSPGDSK